jgi:hypothetical protein
MQLLQSKLAKAQCCCEQSRDQTDMAMANKSEGGLRVHGRDKFGQYEEIIAVYN